MGYHSLRSRPQWSNMGCMGDLLCRPYTAIPRHVRFLDALSCTNGTIMWGTRENLWIFAGLCVLCVPGDAFVPTPLQIFRRMREVTVFKSIKGFV